MASKIAKGTFYLTVSTVVFIITGYLTNIWLGRYLGPILYGSYGVLTSLLTALNIMQVSGVPQAVSKFEAESPNRSEEILLTGLKIQLILMVLLTMLLILLAPLGAHIFHDQNLVRYIRIISLVLPAYGLYSLFIGYYNGRHQFGRQAILSVIYSAAKLVFVVGLALAFSLIGAISGFIIAPIIALVFGWHFPRTKKGFPVKQVIIYSLPLIGFAALSTLQLSVDLFSVKALIAIGAIAGYYTAAQNICLVPFIGMGAIGHVLFPNIARFMSSDQHDKAAVTTTQAIRWLLLMLLPLVALIIGSAPGLVRILYGTRYLPVVPILRILVIGYIGLTVFALLANIMNGAGRAKLAMLIAGSGVVIALVACLLLIPHFGANGAAWATNIGAWLVTVAAAVYARRIVAYSVKSASVVKIVVGAAAIGALAWLIVPSLWLLPLWWIILGFVYAGWLWLTREFTAEDLRMLRNLLPGRKAVQS